MKNLKSAVAGSSANLARRSLFLAAPGAGVVLAQTLAAQTPTPAAGPVKIGVLDAERALAGTKDGQKAQAELEQKLGPKYQELQKMNTDIQDAQKKLDQGGNTMAAATKADLQNSIQTKQRAFQRAQQDFQDEDQKQRSLVLADLYSKMQEVITKYANDNGYSLILNVAQDNTPVLWVSNQIEITQAIIEAYDKAGPITPKTAAPAKPPAAGAPKPPAIPAPKPPAAPGK